MMAEKHKLLSVECRATFDNGPVLASRHLNVMVPTMRDLADSLPSTWKADICNCKGFFGTTQPNQQWLDRFWRLVNSSCKEVPGVMRSFAVVPITGGRLASVAHCASTGTLAHRHLQGLPSTAAATLSAIGCLCIADSEADSVCPIKQGSEPLTTALEAVSSHTGIALEELLSPKKLGSTVFGQARALLAYHMSKQQLTDAEWVTLAQCPVFEDMSGSMMTLPSRIALLPSAAWEQHISELSQLLPWTPVKFHTASELQRKLLQHSGKRAMSLKVLLADLLPLVSGTQPARAEPLLLQALDELAQQPDHKVSSLTHIFVNGRLHPINRCVSCSSAVLNSLFSQHEILSSYILLPSECCTAQRQTVLKRHGLAHEGTPDPHFFIHCSKRFYAIKDNLSRDDSRRLSRLLVDMLQGNADSYQNKRDSDTSLSLSACPVFKSADLQFPYSNSEHPAFTSLRHSADHDHYRLVSLAVPVTDNAHGDTKQLRRKLGLPAEPMLEHVVNHMLKMAAAGHMENLSKQSSKPLFDLLLQDTQQAYHFIVMSISQKLAAPGGTNAGLDSNVTAKLAQEPWIWVAGCQFVRPNEVCFNLEDTAQHGNASALLLATSATRSACTHRRH